MTWLSATTLDISIISAHQGSRTDKLPGQAGPTLDTLSVLKVCCGIHTWDFWRQKSHHRSPVPGKDKWTRYTDTTALLFRSICFHGLQPVVSWRTHHPTGHQLFLLDSQSALTAHSSFQLCSKNRAITTPRLFRGELEGAFYLPHQLVLNSGAIPALNFILSYCTAKTNQQPQKTSELTFVWLAGVKGRQDYKNYHCRHPFIHSPFAHYTQ